MDSPVSPLMRVEQPSIRVSDLDERIAWYRDIVGLAEVARSDDRVYLDPMISAGIEFLLPGGQRTRVAVPEGRCTRITDRGAPYRAWHTHRCAAKVDRLSPMAKRVGSEIGAAAGEFVHGPARERRA